MSRAPATRVAVLLFAASALLYCTNLRVMGAWDSLPARWLPFSVLRQGNLDLDEFGWLRQPAAPYFLRQSDGGHWLSAYPVVTGLLATPFYLPALAWARWHGLDDDDVRLRLAAAVSERFAAAAIAAASVSLLFLALLEITSLSTAAGIAIVYAVGSSTWSVGSQALWQHGSVELGLAGLSWALLRPPTRAGAIGAGAFAALAVAARPTALVFALLATVFTWRHHRHLAAFLLVPVVGGILLLAYNFGVVGRLTGGYNTGKIALPEVGRLLGLLFSPNRGLLVYTPAAILALPLPWWGRGRGWPTYLLIGIGAHLVVFSGFVVWWAGYSYGPRYLCDVLPALAVCAVPAVDRLRRFLSGRVLLALLATWSIGVQVIGVYFDDGTWNRLPASVDERPERLWDWHDLQIVRALNDGFHGADAAGLMAQAFSDPRPVLLRPLPAAALAGTIAVLGEAPRRALAGATLDLDLRLANVGTAPWPGFSDYGFRQVGIAYRWTTTHLQKSPFGAYEERQITNMRGLDALPLPRNLPPGDSLVVRVHLRVPPAAGTYSLDVGPAQLLDHRDLTRIANLSLPVEVR